jgi:glycosyltransferase involved in cell wall biosynthesis
MRKVLFLAYYFQPLSNGGVIRAGAFVKYLPQYGWQPIVLTVDDRYYLSQTIDETLAVESLDGVSIYRTHSFEPKGKMASDFTASVYGIQNKGVFFERWMKPVLRQVFHSLVIPDEHLLWLPYAIRKGLQLIKRHNIDAILVTTPPHSAGLIAAILSKLTGKPLIWDVRDDWIHNPLFYKGPWHSKAIARFLERQLVRTAYRIVTVTQESVDAFTHKYPTEADKFEFIPNGFDPQEFVASHSNAVSTSDAVRKVSNRLRLIYIGTLSAKRSPISLFEAIKQTVNKSLNNIQIKLDIYGYSRADFQEISTKMGLDGIVEFHGFVSRAESLRQLLMSDASLMIIPQEEGSATAIPGKLYEYLGAKKFVLALCDSDSAAGKLIRELNLGVICPQNDIEQIKCALQNMLVMHNENRLEPDLTQENINVYERSTQSKRLACLMESMIG